MKQILLCDDCKVQEVAPLSRERGYGIEVQAFYNPHYLEEHPTALDEHKTALKNITPVSLHGCFGDLCPGSFDGLVRGVTRMRMERSYWVASTLGATHLIFHHGYVPKTSPGRGWIKHCTEFWQEFLDSKDGGIKIHLENMLEWDSELISEVVASIDRPNLDINLDIGHAHCNSKLPIIKWIEQLGTQIGYVHLHDNQGQEDEHLGLGEGTIPIKDVCQALNQYAPGAVWALEAFGEGLRNSIEWLEINDFLK